MSLLLALVTLGAMCGGCLRVEVIPPGASRDRSLERRPSGICPPFPLRTEAGEVIDPFDTGPRTQPYSPRATCGATGCHDYEKITEGYHFTQGAGEAPPEHLEQRCQWVTSPGNYGGAWCSPAPLYRYLSRKENDSAAEMDMTSFSFLTDGCGACHPGGGPAEHDREGHRYDHRMSDPASGLQSGGENGFDGDYFKARWSESGVLEADCLICHLPGYAMDARRAQIKRWNLRWAATAGAGLASVTGTVKDGARPAVQYDPSHFGEDRAVDLHLVREPRNEACLFCHDKPGWKKRGTNFRARTDVHLRAGLKCVDCHPAGSSAGDERIRGREVHQIAKGDDPGGLVRDDLDGTVRTCEACHREGDLGAPRSTHAWLPPLHLEELSCQACHIPERAIKAALVQAGDVFNPGARIPSKGKHLWTFYGPDGRYWNHYGDLEMMGYDDKPTDPFSPVYIRYKGKIYPANRVHSAWPAIETEGSPGLMQPRMGDIYKMWAAHRQDPSRYPTLAQVADDSGDGVIEIDRPEEIDALIQAVTLRLGEVGYPMSDRRVVWVSDARVYRSGETHRSLETREFEASPYANVHTYNHGVAPAKAALGSGGCVDCHRVGAPMFDGGVLAGAFDGPGAGPTWRANHELLGLSALAIRAGALREEWLKPVVYWLSGFLLLLLLGFGLRERLATGTSGRWSSLVPAALVVAGTAALVVLGLSREWCEFLLLRRFTLDANHGWVSILAFGASTAALIVSAASREGVLPSSRVHRWVIRLGAVGLGLAGACGILMILDLEFLSPLTRLAYTGFEAALCLALVAGALAIVLRWSSGPARSPRGWTGDERER